MVWGVRCCSQGAQSDCATLAHTVTMVTSCFQLGRELPYTEPERGTHIHAHVGAQVYFQLCCQPFRASYVMAKRDLVQTCVSATMPGSESALGRLFHPQLALRWGQQLQEQSVVWVTAACSSKIPSACRPFYCPKRSWADCQGRISQCRIPELWKDLIQTFEGVSQLDPEVGDTGAKPLLGLWCSESS